MIMGGQVWLVMASIIGIAVPLLLAVYGTGVPLD